MKATTLGDLLEQNRARIEREENDLGMSARPTLPSDYRSTEPVGEPELFSVNSAPVSPVHELLNAQQREIALVWGLARANQTIRDCMAPTKEQVLAALSAVESMAYSFAEQGTCHGDLESAFERLYDQIKRDRKPSREQAMQDAKATWYGDELGT